MAAAEHPGVTGQAGELDVAVALNDRHRRLDVGQAAQRIGVGDGQRAHVAEHAAEAAGAGHARADGQVARAELGEVVLHVAAQAVADGGEQGHGGDADGHPEQGQQAAQGPAEQRRAAQAQTVAQLH